MRSVNKVIIIGNLTRDTEMRQTPNGQSVTTFGLATNREWATKEGDRKSSAEFHECVAWARLAEICNQFLKKGNLVYVEGYLKTRSWDSPEGIKKFKTEIVVQDMIMLEKKKGGSSNDDYVPSSNSEFEEDNEPAEIENPEKEESHTEEPVAEEKKTEVPAEPPIEVKETPEEQQEEKKEENPIDKDLGL